MLLLLTVAVPIQDLRFCTIDGGAGPTWKSRWGTFDDYGHNGFSAAEVCCACGGAVFDHTPGKQCAINLDALDKF